MMFLTANKSILNPRSIHPQLTFADWFQSQAQSEALGETVSNCSYSSGAVTLNGSSSYIMIPAQAYQSWSVRIRFKLDVLDVNQSIFSLWDGISSNYYANFEFSYVDSYSGFMMYTGSIGRDTNYDLLTNDYVDVLVTRNWGTKDYKLYVNGNLEKTDSTFVSHTETTEYIVIGKRANNSMYLDGSVDLIELYDTDLTPVQTLYLS